MKLLFAFIFAASAFTMPMETNNAALENTVAFLDESAAEKELPRSIRVCWEVFGAEIICMTVEESFMGREVGKEITGKATFNSRNNSMTLKMPLKSSGTMVVEETISFKVKGKEKTIKGGTKISVRNGVATIPLKA
jgi:hypothetical protein